MGEVSAPEAVVFDGDGLLLDTEGAWSRAEIELFRCYGAEFTPTCILMRDGIDMPTTYVSPTELTFEMNPAVPPAPISLARSRPIAMFSTSSAVSPK